MSLQIIQGQTGYVNPALSSLDSGWSISGGYATHTSCNSGVIISLTPLGLVVGKQYTVEYIVDQYINGSVNLVLGSNSGESRTANGDYQETLTCTGNASILFFSDGSLRLSKVKFWDVENGEISGVTISFREDSNTWGSDYSYQPEMMIKFLDDFLAVKNGNLWLHNDNPIRNNFYGVQYSSKVRFYININPTTIKLFYGLRVKSNKVWYSPGDTDILIYATEEKPNGMASRLKKNKFVSLYGDWFADFLRNLLDPRFENSLDALLGGDELRGDLMELNLINDDTVEVILFEVDVEVSKMNYTR